MNEDDFLLDEEDDLEEQEYISPEEEDEDSDSGEEEDDETASKPTATESDYGGRMTRDEIFLSSYYDDIAMAAKKSLDKVSMGGGRAFDSSIVDAARTVITAAPKNTSTVTIENFVKELFQTQGHNRIPSSLYAPDQPLRGTDLEDGEFNAEYTREARNNIARFIDYLANRDLSKDSITSRNRKLRHIPALIIFLFSSGMYDLILNCETMPEEYATQISQAFKKIQQQKYDVVEALAQIYEKRGRQKVADRVRKMGLEWFTREPAEITTRAEYADLELDHQDVIDYRDIRPRFVAASKTITQELISDMIEVVLDKKAGIYERLKDKTRADAIADVKQVYKEWSKENPIDSELANKIIWKDFRLAN